MIDRANDDRDHVVYCKQYYSTYSRDLGMVSQSLHIAHYLTCLNMRGER